MKQILVMSVISLFLFKASAQCTGDCKNGYGTMRYTDGVYEGMWFEGKRHGLGKLITSNGDKYIGNFLDDRYNGRGTYYWSNGRVYDGDWISGNMCGYGKMTYADNSYYEGSFDNDKRNGFGTMYEMNGQISAGAWKDDRYNGFVLIKFGNGSIDWGAWRSGNKIGTHRLTDSSGNTKVEVFNN
jgi:hypothetical protein